MLATPTGCMAWRRHPTHCLICTQVIVYDLIDEDMNGTLAKEELVKACGEVSGGVFLR